MIKFIVKLVVVALIANATWRIGSAYANTYRFEDAVHQAAQFRGRQTDEDLRKRLAELAVEYDVPMKAEDFQIHTQPTHYLIDASYIRPIEVAPGFTYPWPFSVHVDLFLDR